jgi:transposase
MFTRYFRLTRKQAAVLDYLIEKDNREKVRQRAAAIRLIHQGASSELVGTALGVSPMTVYSWYNCFLEQDADGLANHRDGDTQENRVELLCRFLSTR